ncbi:MAG: hypothetical protein ACK4P3_08735, partial [Fimbriimonadaceae bacterium]
MNQWRDKLFSEQIISLSPFAAGLSLLMVLVTAARFHGKGVTQVLMPLAWFFMALFFGSLWLSWAQSLSVTVFAVAVGLLVADFLT